jgi:hypothetical protein
LTNDSFPFFTFLIFSEIWNWFFCAPTLFPIKNGKLIFKPQERENGRYVVGNPKKQSYKRTNNVTLYVIAHLPSFLLATAKIRKKLRVAIF